MSPKSSLTIDMAKNLWQSADSFLCFFFSPETQSYIQKIEGEKAEKQKEGMQDNRSFFAKYVSIFHAVCRHKKNKNEWYVPEQKLLTLFYFMIRRT